MSRTVRLKTKTLYLSDFEEALRCPVCGESMHLKMPTRPTQRWKPFFGCINFPSCGGKLLFDIENEDHASVLLSLRNKLKLAHRRYDERVEELRNEFAPMLEELKEYRKRKSELSNDLDEETGNIRDQFLSVAQEL